MKTYNVSVRVDFFYEVEAENEEAAREQGWAWEDYIMHGEVYSIDIEEVEEED